MLAHYVSCSGSVMHRRGLYTLNSNKKRPVHFQSSRYIKSITYPRDKCVRLSHGVLSGIFKDGNRTPARKAMKQYWDKWAEYKTESGTAFEMMLLETSGYDYTKKLSDLDVKEMISLLPDLQGVDLLELGAAVG